MKNYLLLLFLLTASLTLNAQKTKYYEGQGTITLESGDVLTGEVVYRPNTQGHVRFKGEGMDKFEKQKLNDVASFTVDGNSWETKINKGAIAANNRYFMQALSSTDSKIKVYKYEQQAKVGSDNNFPITTEYFVQIDDSKEVLAVGHLKFTPFKKVAKLVSDCPDLAKKIEKKSSGYKIGLISSDLMKAEMFQKISNEYAECK